MWSCRRCGLSNGSSREQCKACLGPNHIHEQKTASDASYNAYRTHNDPRTTRQSAKIPKKLPPSKLKKSLDFTEDEKSAFGVVHISQLRQREQMQCVGTIFDLKVPPILSHLDQIAPAIDSCLLYAAGFCKFGARCPCLQVDARAHDGRLAIERERTWRRNLEDINCVKVNKMRAKPQAYDFCVVLDLEGLPEIIDLPAVLIDLKALRAVSKFHRYVEPQQWIKQGILSANKSSANIRKECSNAHSNAVSFTSAINALHRWLAVENKLDLTAANRVLFATCGNWDIAKQIPLQYFRCGLWRRFPKHLFAWCNIKDFGLNLYGKTRKADKRHFRGMKSLLAYLKIPLRGTHHSGMDDSSNLCKIVLTFVKHRGVLKNTARRCPQKQFKIQFEHDKAHRIGW